MSRPDGRIEPGQPLRGAISARAWNRMMDAADIVHSQRLSILGGSSAAKEKPYTWVYCKPSVTVARWGVLAITGVDISPTSSDSDEATVTFQDTPVITAGTPSSSTSPWCVAVEPIESGKVGRVAVGGVVQLKAADIRKAVGAHVLWKDSRWALIRIQSGIVRGTFTGSWVKGTSTTVTDATNGTTTYLATNYFASLTGGDSKACALANVAGEWILIAAEC